MKEGIAARVTRIISGSVNALIDAVESAAPAVMMEETIREIDGATDEVRTELRELVANRHMANARLMEENRRHEDLAEGVAQGVTIPLSGCRGMWACFLLKCRALAVPTSPPPDCLE